MIPDSYSTISRQSKAVFKDRNSKFLAFAFPVSNQEEVREIIAQIKKEYHDARHHCYGYILGVQNEISKAHDDGEPHHSAGDPILGQIRSRELSDALLVVVRYFGGVKLAISGLIHAYRTAASLALDANRIITQPVYLKFRIQFPYEKMNPVMRLIKEQNLKILNQTFEEVCDMEVGVLPSLANQIHSGLNEVQIEILPDSTKSGN